MFGIYPPAPFILPELEWMLSGSTDGLNIGKLLFDSIGFALP